MFPFLQKRDPSLTFDALVAQNSLKFLEDYLRRAEKIGLMHNEDDIILAEGEFPYLADLFAGDRSRLYLTGGHCGNLPYLQNVADMIAFFPGGLGGNERNGIFSQSPGALAFDAAAASLQQHT